MIEGTQIAITATNAVYSSIQNEISAPKADYAAVIAYFYSTKECQEYGSAHICECEGQIDPTYPSISLQLADDVTLELEQQWYLKYHSDGIFG